MEVLFIALAAVMCGAETCCDMAEFGASKSRMLREVLPLRHGVPSHDTFSRVFRLLDPKHFETAFARFAEAFAAPLQGVVAVDGKALRGAYLRGRKATPLHLVNVWAAEARLAIGQRRAPGRNEVAGVLQVLATLRLEGCIVTADALHCRADTAAAILASGGDYALAIKQNQPGLLAQAQQHTERAADAHAQSTVGHDRSEHRRSVVVPMSWPPMPGLVAVGRVQTWTERSGVEQAPMVRYYALSAWLTPAEMLGVSRQHWEIENKLHWMLDVALGEDRARSRKDNAPDNLAILRKLALNILRQHPDKTPIRRKIKRAGWDEEFLLQLLAHMR